MVFATVSVVSASSASAATGSSVGSKVTAKKKLTKKQKKRLKRKRIKLRRIKKIDKAERVAARQKGDPYRYGASGPGSFDCSGLTSYSFKKAGIKLPRTADSQYHRVRKIKKRNAKKGDLVFFGGSRKYHVGIYWGKKRILHSPYSGSRVKVEKIWTRSWSAGTLRKRF
ncbi:UNVERIFIED_CONTAM: hypothetical protein LK11_58240 [Mumia flava]|nr:C40 family peptidase [Mumia flava]